MVNDPDQFFPGADLLLFHLEGDIIYGNNMNDFFFKFYLCAVHTQEDGSTFYFDGFCNLITRSHFQDPASKYSMSLVQIANTIDPFDFK